jgi:hypothetical protein
MQEFSQKFYSTLVFNVATITAIIVGVFQFAIRSFNENNGKEKVRNFTLQVLNFIDGIIETSQSKLETVPAKVTKTRTRKSS